MITVADVIASALPAGTTVIAGAAGLDREVTWATRLRQAPPAFAHLGLGELVLLPERVLDQLDERLTLEAAIRQMARFGVAAIAIIEPATDAARLAADETSLPLLQLPVDADLGPLEREAARMITERRREVQRKGQEIGRRLMELAIAGEPLSGMVGALAEIAGRAVVLQARDGRLLAYHGGAPRGPARERIEPLLLQEQPTVGRWLRATAASSPAEPPTATYPLDHQWQRVVAPISGRDGLLGSVSLIVPCGEATPEDGLAGSRGAAACAVVLAREHAATNARREVELHVLDEVLDGALRSEATLLQQAKRLNQDLQADHVAIVARLDYPPSAGPVRAQGRDDFWSMLDDVLAKTGSGRAAQALWRIRHNSAEIVWPTISVDDAERLARLVQAELRGRLDEAGGGSSAVVSVGIGTSRAGLLGIRRSHQEARQAIALGRRLAGPGRLTRFDQLGVYRLIFAAESLPEIAALHEEALGRLIAYDREHDADLINTLHAYFAARCSPKEAAERLHLHRNTVLYRLDRIKDLTDLNLDNADTRLWLHLALLIHLALFAERE